MTDRTLREKIASLMEVYDHNGGTAFVVKEHVLRILDAHAAAQPQAGEIEDAVSGGLHSVVGGRDSLARDGALIEQAKALLAINASGNAVPRVPNLAVEIIQRFIDTDAHPAPPAIADAPVSDRPGPDAEPVAWQAMDTAPTDGTKFAATNGRLTFTTYSQQYYEKFPHEEGGPIYKSRWTAEDASSVWPWNPTHWTPLAKEPRT